MRCTLIVSMIAALGFGSAFAIPTEGAAAIAKVNALVVRDVAADAAIAAVADADNVAERPYGYDGRGRGYDGGRGYGGHGGEHGGYGYGRGY